MSKPISEMKKAELQSELDLLEVAFHTKATVEELRSLLKEARGPKVKDPMSGSSSKTLPELQVWATELGLETKDMRKGDLLRMIREHFEGQPGLPMTCITFGRHKGKSYEEVRSTDHQYLDWCRMTLQEEVQTDISLRRFVLWADHLEGRTTPNLQSQASSSTTQGPVPKTAFQMMRGFNVLPGIGVQHTGSEAKTQTSVPKAQAPKPKPKYQPVAKAPKAPAPERFSIASEIPVPEETEEPPQWDGRPDTMAEYLVAAREFAERAHKDNASMGSWTMTDAEKRARAHDESA